MNTRFHAWRVRHRQTHRRHSLVWALLLLFSGLLGGCVATDLPVPLRAPTPTALPPPLQPPTPSPTPPVAVTLRYALWDAAQEPAYAACAAQFMARYPHITILIERTAWPAYWDTLFADLASGDAPDVFVNHTTRLPDLAAAGHLLDLQPLVERDNVDDTIYIGRLPRLWVRSGVRYGLPKDWDTVALVYNKQLTAQAGVSEAELNQLDWNPVDGGSFQQMLARLTIDSAGNNALSPTFDAQNVRHYGLTMAETDGGGAYGQQQWSWLAASNGFRFTDYLYATRYHYDAPELIATMQWYQRLINELGYHSPFDQVAEQNGRQLFLDGQAAMIADGSWTISQYVNDAPFEVGFARLPVGPLGRKSMFNGLADSIWSGTPHVEAAWQWVRYLGSVECQLTVGKAAVTFPALLSGVNQMIAHYTARGIDISAFTEQALTPEGIFLFPVTEHAAEIGAIMQPVIVAILRGEADPATALPAANARVNALFAP